MYEFIRDIPLEVILIVVYLLCGGLLIYGVSMIRQLIKDWRFIQKHKIFFEKELKEREMKKDYNRWMEEWKELSYKYDSISWDYNYIKKRFLHTKKIVSYWLFLLLLLFILILILNK